MCSSVCLPVCLFVCVCLSVSLYINIKSLNGSNLERLLKFCQLVEALFDYVGRPLIDFVVSVGISADGALDGLFDDVANFVDDEGRLLGSVEIIHSS